MREGGGETASLLLNIQRTSWVGTTEQLTSRLYDQREDYSGKTSLMLLTVHTRARYLAELWLLSVLVCNTDIVKSVLWLRVPPGVMLQFYWIGACGSLSVWVGNCKFLFILNAEFAEKWNPMHFRSVTG